MTSTPVASSYKASYKGYEAGTTSSPQVSSKDSFSEIFKNQSGQDKKDLPPEKSATENTTVTNKTQETKEPVKPAQDTKTDDTSKSETVTKPSKEDAKPVDKEDMEEATEAAEALVGELLVQITKELNVTMEDVLQAMDSLEMSSTDLLDSNKLTALVANLSGEDNMVSLVTNEELYTSLQNLTQLLTESLEDITEETGITPRQLTEAMLKKDDQNIPEILTEVSEKFLSEASEEDDLKAIPTSKEDGTKGSLLEEGEEAMLERSLNASERSGNQASSGNTGQDQTGNLFSQNQIFTQTTPEVINTGLADSLQASDTEFIMDQIMDYMKVQVGEGTSQLELQLHPESLGTLNIHLTSKEGLVTAQFVTQNDAVKNALESQMVQLKQTFEEQGVKVEAIEVSVESHRFDENNSQNSGNGQTSEEHSQVQGTRRSRRLNLDLLDDLSEVELTQEERLTMELMEANGNTVDYTV